IWFLMIPLCVFMYFISPFIFKLWIGSNVTIPKTLSFALAFYALFASRANLYMTLINGTGHLLIQLITYLLFAIIAVPLMILFTQKIGTEGIVMVPVIFFLFFI